MARLLLIVTGSMALGALLGFSTLVIVGFGTSMPELATSVEAAMVGAPAIAWGNPISPTAC